MANSRQAFAEVRFAHQWTPSRFDLTRAARLRTLLTNRPRGPLLDVGCYDGQFLARVVEREQRILVGIDVSASALAMARRRGISPLRAQAESGLPFRNAAFATVLAAEVIEHVFDTQHFVNEAARVLRPGGWLAITTPNLVALSGRAQLLLGRSP